MQLLRERLKWLIDKISAVLLKIFHPQVRLITDFSNRISTAAESNRFNRTSTGARESGQEVLYGTTNSAIPSRTLWTVPKVFGRQRPVTNQSA